MGAFRVDFEAPTTGVPARALAKVRADLAVIAEEVAALHPHSPIWESMREAGLRLLTDGWVFTYLVDERAQVLRVVSIARADPAP